jgi:hypothetical protein
MAGLKQQKVLGLTAAVTSLDAEKNAPTRSPTTGWSNWQGGIKRILVIELQGVLDLNWSN